MTPSIRPIPKQLQPIPFFASFEEQAGELLTYSRNFLRLVYKNQLTSEIEIWISQYEPRTESLVVGDVGILINRYPNSIQEDLHNQIQQLLNRLGDLYPLPEGENFQSAQVTVLTEGIDDYPPGTVVYIRQTNRATIYFLLTHLVINLKTGRYLLVGLNPLSPSARQTISFSPLSASASDFFFTIAGSLVWALPGPWGAIGSAFLGGLGLLCGNNEDLGQIISTAISEAVKQLEQYELHLKATDDITVIEDFANWMNNQISLINANFKDTYIPNYFILGSQQSEITGGMLPDLRDKLDKLHFSITNLELLITGFDPLDENNFFNFYMQAISLYLLGQKWVLQLEAQAATNFSGQQNRPQDDTLNIDNVSNFDEYNNKWRIDYSRYEIAINGDGTDSNPGFIKQAQKLTDFVSNTRVDSSNITDVYHYEWREDDHRGGYIYHTGWTWQDLHNHDNTTQNFVDDTYDSCCGDPTCHKDVADNNRNNWIKACRKSYADKYQYVEDDCYKKWQASIYEWNEHLPPIAPKTSPAIAPKSWQGKPPKSTYWKTGNKVAYALSFSNDSGISPLGGYCSSQEIQENFGVTITNIPQEDPLKMATKIRIFRKITDSNQNVLEEKIIAGKNIGFDSYQDVSKS